MSADPNTPSDPALDDESSADWAAWEQTFRNARPVLPDAALERIEKTIRLEAARVATARAKRPSRLIFWTAVAIIIAAGALTLFTLWRTTRNRPAETSTPEPAPLVNDVYSLEMPIEPPPATTQHIDTSPRPLTQATVQARSKAVNEGVITYTGSVLLSAGPWRIACDRLTVFHSAGHAALLNGTGTLQITGISRITQATADEISLDTENGDLKLKGHVRSRADGHSESYDERTISRFGEPR